MFDKSVMKLLDHSFSFPKHFNGNWIKNILNGNLMRNRIRNCKNRRKEALNGILIFRCELVGGMWISGSTR